MNGRKILPILALLLLSACESFPSMQMKGADFKPLSFDVAQMAAPQDPNAAAKALFCSVGKGSVRVDKGWADYKGSVDFTLPAGGKTQVPLKTNAGTLNIQGFFDTEGQKLVFCPVVDAAPDERIACSSIYALEDDLQMGIKRTFDVPDAVNGAAITCAYDKSNLKKL